MLRALCLFVMVATSMCRPYDPEDGELKTVLPSSGEFEAFYPRQSHGIPNGSSRPAHGHGSFYKHRNPALIDVKNAAAYGFRFDGINNNLPQHVSEEPKPIKRYYPRKQRGGRGPRLPAISRSL